MNQVKKTQKEHEIWLSNIESLSFQMETYGIYAVEDKKASFIDVVLALHELVLSGDSFIALISDNFSIYEKIQSRQNLFLPFNYKNLSEMRDIHKKLILNGKRTAKTVLTKVG